MLYGSECWAVTKRDENALAVAEMRMLRCATGITRRDRVRNEETRKRLGVRDIADKVKGRRLQWFGHIERRPDDYVGKMVNKMRAPTKKRQGGQPMTWRRCINGDMRELGIMKELAEDREQWKKLTCMADPTTQRE